MQWPTTENQPLNIRCLIWTLWLFQHYSLMGKVIPLIKVSWEIFLFNRELNIFWSLVNLLMVNGCTLSLTTLDFHTGLSIWFIENTFHDKVEYFWNKTQVRHISLLMTYKKWLSATTQLYSRPKYYDMLATLQLKKHTGIKWEGKSKLS